MKNKLQKAIGKYWINKPDKKISPNLKISNHLYNKHQNYSKNHKRRKISSHQYEEKLWLLLRY